jgi:hypothetical protein
VDGKPVKLKAGTVKRRKEGGRKPRYGPEVIARCQQVKRKENKKGPQITRITRIFVPKFLLICENLRNPRIFFVPIFLTC